MRCSISIGLVVIGLAVWLYGVRCSQLGPHLVRHYVAGRLVSETVTTNPVYFSFTATNRIGGGVEIIRQTNFYWSVWGVWR